MKKILILLIVGLLLSACNTPITPTPAVIEPPESNVFSMDQTISGWTPFYFTLSPKETVSELARAYTENNTLWFDISIQSTYLYLMKDQSDYADVEMTATYENFYKERNYIALVCRYSPAGWYEFNVSSTGLTAILKYSQDTGYTKLGQEQNETSYLSRTNPQTITAKCYGQSLTLLVNGTELFTYMDDSYTSGQIGISVGSEKYVPIRVGVTEFTWK